MPLFAYSCQDCDHSFETLSRVDETPACPACGGDHSELGAEIALRLGSATLAGAVLGLNRELRGKRMTTSALDGIPARRIFVHINNTNPMLIDGSPERAVVEAAGWEVAEDGMEIVL